MNKFELGDMDWLKGILNGQADNMLSHGRTERIINRIEELEQQLADLSKLELKLRLSDRNNYYAGVRQDIAADMREIIHREKSDVG